MVMGPTHAMSGAAAWLAGAAPLAATLGHSMTGSELVVGAGVCAGAALLPDIDMPKSTVARSLGPVTIVLAHLVDALALGFYNLTRNTKDDRRSGGHRTLTHTALFAVLAGAGVSALCGWGGFWATIGTLFFTLSLAIRGLMADWAKEQGWLVVAAASAAVSYGVASELPHQSYWWLGFAVTIGMLLHDLGDMITKQGCPLLAPLPHRGKSWWEFAPPGFLRIEAGGFAEYVLVLPAVTVTAVGAAAWAYDPDLVRSVLALG